MVMTADSVLERVKEAWRPRFLANGVEPYDYETTVARVQRWDDWPREWRRTAEEHVAAADAAEVDGHLMTAANERRLAALAYHFAHFNFPDPKSEWVDATRRKVALFRKVAPYLDPPAERVEIPFERIRIPAYLRKPRDVARPPVALMFSGLDSTKEEHTPFENVLLRRGLATLAFDGPGQGEVWEHMPGRVDWERAASAVVDYAQGRADVDGGRLVALGVSLGGYLVTRSAAFDPRIRAAACCGGRFDQADRRLDDPMHGARLMHFWNKDAAETRKLLDASTLEGVIERMTRPLLVVHGARDNIAPVESARRIYESAPGPKRWVLYPEGNHVCNNIPHKYRPLVADWLAEQVAAGVRAPS